MSYLYDVFLSFRGEDTRKTFTDHLYTALIASGLQTFRDDDSIQRGEDVSSEIKNAIEQSRSSIIVFSKDYASSGWCLDEVYLILQRRKATTNHVILPVFYDVDPTEVRKQTGSFAKAFRKHEKKHHKIQVEKWKGALGEAADLAGMVLKNQEDGIVGVIGEKLYQAIPILSPSLVGIDTRSRKINQWVQDWTSDVGIAAICGMGGIGKTTVAKLVYNTNLKYFEGGSFLHEIRETSKRSDGLIHLQKKLLSDILKRKGEEIRSVDEGILKIQDALCSKRILLVLDDVDHVDQINAIFGIRNWFHPGSKVIITTRHEHLIKSHEPYISHEDGDHFCNIYKLEPLDEDESYRLFCLYAFGKDFSIGDYATECERIVRYCGGLPLALIVLGRALRGKSSIEIWRSMADKLQEIPHNQIMEKLKISYDSLGDDQDKNLFLYIACFFVGKRKDRTVIILDGCEFYTLVGIDTLIGRCLLSVDEKTNKLKMHQLLRDMGREIVRQESPKDPGNRTLLWRTKDSIRVLNEKSGTRKIEGLALDMDVVEEFEVDAFMEMYRLKLLYLKNVQLTSYEKLPKSLIWLFWEDFSSESIPNLLSLEGVVALEMRYSSLKLLWAQNKFLRLLELLDLSHSGSLTNSPDFSMLPNLKKLILKYCTSLVDIDESIGFLEKLVLLNIKQCKKLEKLPNTISKLNSLEILDISGCMNIKQLPDMSKLEFMKVFVADGVPINHLFSLSNNFNTDVVTSQDISYEIVIFKPRIQAPEISWAEYLPRTLVRLSLRNCGLLDNDFPKNFHHFLSLRELDLSENLFSNLPDFIRHLQLLELSFSKCLNLQSLEGLPKVEDLNVGSCTSLKKITYKSSDSAAAAIAYERCESLAEIGTWFKIEPLHEVDVELTAALGLNKLKIPPNTEVMYRNLYGFPCQPFLQGIYEPGGLFSTFVPGDEIPRDSFHHTSNEPTMYLSVAAPHSNQIVGGLNICTVYSHPCVHYEEDVLHMTTGYFQKIQFPNDTAPLFIKVTNITKALKWVYHPIFYGVPKNNDHTTWFCHWKFGNHQLEEGDKLCVSVIVDDAFHVKKLGVNFILLKQDSIAEGRSNSCFWGVAMDLSAFQVKPGVYFLSWRKIPKGNDWISHDGMQLLFGDPEEITDRSIDDGAIDNHIAIHESIEGVKLDKTLIIVVVVVIFFILFFPYILLWLCNSRTSDMVADKRLMFPT